MALIGNLDLFLVGIAIAATGILGIMVYFNDRYSSTGQAFLSFSVMTICWSLLNYLAYRVVNPYLVLWFLRMAIFAAVWHSFSIFQLFYVFPKQTLSFSKKYNSYEK